MEAILGILVIALVLGASAPLLLLSVASRVQSLRTQKALRIAQQEVERVRVMMEIGDYQNIYLPPSVTGNAADLPYMSAPTVISSNSLIYANEATWRDNQNYFVQVFRTDNSNTYVSNAYGSNQILAFRMGVRVYSKLAQAQLGSLETVPSCSRLSSQPNLGSNRPLAVLYVDLLRSDVNESLSRYYKFLPSNPSFFPTASCQ
jgi:type II secretory pathway pseudopilin PulG